MTKDIMTGDLRDLHTYLNTLRQDGIVPVHSNPTLTQCGICRVLPKNNTKLSSNTDLKHIETHDSTNQVSQHQLMGVFAANVHDVTHYTHETLIVCTTYIYTRSGKGHPP
jgi:hypothetical protein